MRILLTGGGTGGHIFPLVSIVRKIREKLGDEAEFLYVGSGVAIEKEVMKEEGIRAKYILAGKARRYFSLMNFVDFFKTPIGFFQSLWILLSFMPDVVFSKGGYVSVPVVMAAWIYRIPIIIHESDAVPGTANRILEKFSNKVAIAYPTTQNYFEASKTALVGNPVREGINSGNKEEARKFFNFTESKPVILVLGGSQGSEIINESVIRILPRILQHAQIIHQTGEKNYEKVVHGAGEQGIKAGREGYFPVPFMDFETIKQAYALADMVISRAGANIIAEIAANAKPNILIPLEHSAQDHQRMNAYEIAKAGGTLVLEESNLGENIFFEKIEKILFDEELKKNMSHNISAFYHPNAAEYLADGLIELGRK
ncbi:MAG: undecaprenyldiphospho-muramoylpentapeptide beta-N-acetylglucosaminyltransferase [Parcubacteria group bacterium]|jgi:UDP-N-acetylglucosamine--N-acetylmuramyl-(pentapeptide) pyrophosphoryl-undecaprenol N-acetylglucosamine transferase